MDLTNLITTENANDGVWFQVELYGEKQDFDLRILGEDSDKVTNFTRKRLKKLQIDGERVSVKKNAIDELLESKDDTYVIRLNGIRTHSDNKEPVTIGEKVLTNNEESYRFLIEKIPAVKEFIMECSQERSNFLRKEKKN